MNLNNDCYHCVSKFEQDSLTSACEMRLNGHSFRINKIDVTKKDNSIVFDMFNNKLRT